VVLFDASRDEGDEDELDELSVWFCVELCATWLDCCCNGNKDDEESEVTVAPSDVEGAGSTTVCCPDGVELVDDDGVSTPEEEVTSSAFAPEADTASQPAATPAAMSSFLVVVQGNARSPSRFSPRSCI
jgi:hypothetical protein